MNRSDRLFAGEIKKVGFQLDASAESPGSLIPRYRLLTLAISIIAICSPRVGVIIADTSANCTTLYERDVPRSRGRNSFIPPYTAIAIPLSRYLALGDFIKAIKIMFLHSRGVWQLSQRV